MTSETDVPRIRVQAPRDWSIRALRGLQELALRHPVAFQAAFSALIAEGKDFARTTEGRAWRDQLARSRLLQRVRLAWETSTLLMLQEEPSDVLPSAYLDALFMVASGDDLEPVLDELFRQAVSDEDDR